MNATKNRLIRSYDYSSKLNLKISDQILCAHTKFTNNHSAGVKLGDFLGQGQNNTKQEVNGEINCILPKRTNLVESQNQKVAHLLSKKVLLSLITWKHYVNKFQSSLQQKTGFQLKLWIQLFVSLDFERKINWNFFYGFF